MSDGYIVVNRYYTDSGTEYAIRRLIEEGQKQSIELEVIKSGAVGYEYYGNGREEMFYLEGCKFAFSKKPPPILFFDKDTKFASAVERHGHRVINQSCAIEICNDKIATYSALSGSKIKTPDTLVSPLIYDVNDGEDMGFLALVEGRLEYPIVVKENVGSQGRQVYLAKDRAELKTLNKKLRHIPHHYQRYYGNSAQCGGDIRVYVVGGKARISVRRTNTADFRGNVCLGATVVKLDDNEAKAYEAVAVKASKRLKLDYCAVDFADYEGEPILLEVNSNAYFESVEKACGANIAREIICLLKKFKKLNTG